MMEISRQTGRGLIIHDGKLLMMERWRGGLHYYSIPGGGIEEGETPEQAALRELDEELGVDVRIIRKVYEVRIDDKIHHIFLCEYLGGEPSLQPSAPEAAENAAGHNRFKPGWVELKELGSIPLVYWEPLRQYLIDDTRSGFDVDTKTITV